MNDNDNLFNLDNLIKISENKQEWILTNENKQLQHYQYRHKTINCLYLMHAKINDISQEKFNNHVYSVNSRVENL